MAINYNEGISSLDTGAGGLDAGAEDITYTGNEGPKSPQEEMQIAGGEYNRVLELLEKVREGGPLSEEEKIELQGLIRTLTAKGIDVEQLIGQEQGREGIQMASAADPMLEEQAVAGMATGGRAGYRNGYSVQGGVKNYLGDQETVSGVPVKWKSGPGKPDTELAYITKAEKDLILKKDLHGSLKDGPNMGPGGLMSLDSWGDIGGGQAGADVSRDTDKGRDTPRDAATTYSPVKEAKAGLKGTSYKDRIMSPADIKAEEMRKQKLWERSESTTPHVPDETEEKAKGFVLPTWEMVKKLRDKHNAWRRKRFMEKYMKENPMGILPPGMSQSKRFSPDFDWENWDEDDWNTKQARGWLDELGYADTLKGPEPGPTGGPGEDFNQAPDPCKGPNPPAWCTQTPDPDDPEDDPDIPTDPVTGTPITSQYHIPGAANFYSNLPSALPTGQTTGVTFDPTAEMLKYQYAADGGRVPAAYGGIMGDDGRRAYGLGSLFKGILKPFKGITRGIKKFSKSKAGKMAIMAALMGAPIGGGPGATWFGKGSGWGGLKSGIGNLFTGSKGSVLGKFGTGSKGEILDKVIKGSGEGTGGGFWSKMLGSMKTNPMPWILGTSAAGGLYTALAGDKEEEPEWMKDWKRKYQASLTEFAPIGQASTWEPLRLYGANGGRIGYADAGDVDPEGPRGNPPVIEEIENMREFRIANPDIEDVADYKSYYEILKRKEWQKHLERMRRRLNLQTPEAPWPGGRELLSEDMGDWEWVGDPPEATKKDTNLLLKQMGLAQGGRIGYQLGGGAENIGLEQEVRARMEMFNEDYETALQKVLEIRRETISSPSGTNVMEPGILGNQTIANTINRTPSRFASLGGNTALGSNTAMMPMSGKPPADVMIPERRIGYAKGGNNDLTHKQKYLKDVKYAQEGGLMDLGGMEKDYRNNGGFVPIGGQERADDVPARLSKNEFVFTADAVRAAGGGDIDRGAEIMGNVMENLEQGGQVSEESQGLEGARDMFATAQRLEGVL